MIQPYQNYEGYDSFAIRWNRPLYQPSHYEYSVSCKVQCAERHYFSLVKEVLPSVHSSITVAELLPRSICEVTLIAVYNPASLDPGIALIATTTSRSKLLSMKINVQQINHYKC